MGSFRGAVAQYLKAVREQHSMTNIEMGLKGGPKIIGLRRGDYVEVRVRYYDMADPGLQGRVVRAWVDRKTGNEWANVHFGKNLGGQNLRRKYPANALRKISRPTGVYADRLKASRRREQVLTAQTGQNQGPGGMTGPVVIQRQTIFRAMSMLRDAGAMLNGVPPEGTRGAIQQAQQSIESARLKLNTATSKFPE